MQRMPPQAPPTGGPTTRRRRLAKLEPPPVDYISTLPDELLGEIITLLPVKEGGRTQAIASRWRHLWRCAPLNLDCYEDKSSTLDVSRVLKAHQGPGRRFCVRTQRAVRSVDAWLRSAALDSLEELEFNRFMAPLPASVFRFSRTLRVVTLTNCKLLDSGVRLHFPQLKQLALKCVCIPDLLLQRLIDGCPALEFLLVHTSPVFRSLRINSLTLISICVHIEDDDDDDSASAELPELHSGELVIESAPCLEWLIHMYGFWNLNVSVFFAPKVGPLGFLTDWHNLYTRLGSCSRVIRGLPIDSRTKAVCTVKSLAVNRNISLDAVVDLMRLFPCLEKLHLKAMVSRERNCWRRKHRKFIRYHDIRLKTIVVEQYLGDSSQINFATFFVLNAIILELMTFHIEAKYNNDKFLATQHRKLELENKASRGAQFHFTTASFQHAAWNSKHIPDLGI